jgi:hypothetical protein
MWKMPSVAACWILRNRAVVSAATVQLPQRQHRQQVRRTEIRLRPALFGPSLPGMYCRSLGSDPGISPIITGQPQLSWLRQYQFTARLFLAPSLAPSPRGQPAEPGDLAPPIPGQFGGPRTAANLASTRRTDQLSVGMFLTVHTPILILSAKPPNFRAKSPFGRSGHLYWRAVTRWLQGFDDGISYRFSCQKLNPLQSISRRVIEGRKANERQQAALLREISKTCNSVQPTSISPIFMGVRQALAARTVSQRVKIHCWFRKAISTI